MERRRDAAAAACAVPALARLLVARLVGGGAACVHGGVAAAASHGMPSPQRGGTTGSRDRVAVVAVVRAAPYTRSSRSCARRRPYRIQHSGGLFRSREPGDRGEAAGAVRADGDAARWRWASAAHLAPSFSRRAAGAGHARPRRVLAVIVLRGSEGVARSIPEARVARGSARRVADATRQTTRLVGAGRTHVQRGAMTAGHRPSPDFVRRMIRTARRTRSG